jgi:hypothetical protein
MKNPEASITPHKTTYYYFGDTDEITAILRDGFIDEWKTKRHGKRNRLGVYVTDSPGEPDPNHPENQILEITLPARIDTSEWRLVIPESPPCCWQEWVIPAEILNKHATLRYLSSEEWERTGAQHRRAHVGELREELTAAGLLEHAKDSTGQLMYRNGQPVFRVTEKALRLKPEDMEAALEEVAKAAEAFPPPPITDSTN